MHAPRQVSSRAVTGQPPPGGRRGAAAPRRTAFWLLAAGTVTQVALSRFRSRPVILAVLIFSVLLAALGLFSVSRFARGAR